MSVDIPSYFKQLLPVLENDESVYCLSAWNDQVFPAAIHQIANLISCNNETKKNRA